MYSLKYIIKKENFFVCLYIKLAGSIISVIKTADDFARFI